MKQLKVISSLIIIVAMLMAVAPVQAKETLDTFSFTHACPNQPPLNNFIGETQMLVDVISVDATHVDFTFRNIGPEVSSITDVYFDDGALLGISQIIDGPGTDFEKPATPPNLPCGNNVSPAFETTAGFSADSEPPVQPWGVNPGEQVTIRFELDPGFYFADVIAQLGTGELRIGIHVQGLPDGGSNAFILGPFTSISLASFKTTCSRGSVNVNWTTGTEIDNAGFNIYRSTSADGARTRLNSKLLAAKGDVVSGGSYSFNDAAGYGTFYYWLEDVSYSGKATLHGPTLAVVTPPFRSPLYRPALPSR